MVALRIPASVSSWCSENLELSRGGGAHNIRPMEGLRGFAAFIVFLTHYCGFVFPFVGASAVWPSVIGPLDVIGNSGVDLFFILSGYLIYGSLLSRAQPFGVYLSRRWQRIYPVFTVMFLLYIPLSFAFPSESKIPAPLGEALAYLAANFLLLVPVLVPFDPMVDVTWSLSYEMFYYVLTPILIAVFSLRLRSTGWRVAFFVILALLYAGTFMVFGGKPRLLMFVAGILLYEVIKNTRVRAPGSLLTLTLCTLGLTGYVLAPGGKLGELVKVAVLCVAYFPLCYCCFANPGARLRRIFVWTPLRWFGNLSYSFYMIHALAMQAAILILTRVLNPSADYGLLFFLAMMPVLFVSALVPALVLFLLVERPLSLKNTAQSQQQSSPATTILIGPAQPRQGASAAAPLAFQRTFQQPASSSRAAKRPAKP